MREIPLDTFRKALMSSRQSVVLCGAGVSMLQPTCLPSGNELRDLAITAIFRDEHNTAIIERLLASRAFQAMLPESVFQELGVFLHPHVDRFISRLTRAAHCNLAHTAIAERFETVFTTNFDNCFEQAKVSNVHHLHGISLNPRSLQNRRWRLGRTMPEANEAFRSQIAGRTLFIIGYSLRDTDVRDALASSSASRIFYLSYDPLPPPALADLRGNVAFATGSLEELFSIGRTKRFAATPAPIRQPSAANKALALLYLFDFIDDPDGAALVFNANRHKFGGRERLRALAILANTMRQAQKFHEAEQLSIEAEALSSFSNFKNLDIRSWILSNRALCASEGSGNLIVARQRLREGIRAANLYRRTNSDAVQIDRMAVWRTALANNLANVERDLGKLSRAKCLYNFSLRIKASYHEGEARSITLSNLSVLLIGAGDLSEGARCISEIVEIMKRSPQIYACQTTIFDNSKALAAYACWPTASISFQLPQLDYLEEMALRDRCRPEFMAIIMQLRELQRIEAALHH